MLRTNTPNTYIGGSHTTNRPPACLPACRCAMYRSCWWGTLRKTPRCESDTRERDRLHDQRHSGQETTNVGCRRDIFICIWNVCVHLAYGKALAPERCRWTATQRKHIHNNTYIHNVHTCTSYGRMWTLCKRERARKRERMRCRERACERWSAKRASTIYTPVAIGGARRCCCCFCWLSPNAEHYTTLLCTVLCAPTRIYVRVACSTCSNVAAMFQRTRRWLLVRSRIFKGKCSSEEKEEGCSFCNGKYDVVLKGTNERWNKNACTSTTTLLFGSCFSVLVAARVAAAAAGAVAAAADANVWSHAAGCNGDLASAAKN